MAIAFDTLEYAQRLRRAGFTPEQAEGQAQALAAVMTESIATKQDLRELEARLTATMDARFAAMDGRLDAMETGLVAMEMRLTLRLGGLMVAGVGVVSALVKLL